MTESELEQLRAEVETEIYYCKKNGMTYSKIDAYLSKMFSGRTPKGTHLRKFTRPILNDINKKIKREQGGELLKQKPPKPEPKKEPAYNTYINTTTAVEPIETRTEPAPQQLYEKGKRIKLLVGMFDQHITGVDRTPISRPAQVVYKWCAEHQPDELVIGGDFGDFMSLSKWEEDYPGHKEGDCFDRAVTFCNYNLDIMQSVTRNKKGKLVYTLGNHEVWVEKYKSKDPHARRGIYDVKILFRLEDRKIEWYPINGSYKVGHARIKHGSNANIQHATKTAGSSCGESVFYGHTHDIQCHSGIREIDLLPFVAQSCGCLCNLNPYFMRNRPNKWVHGFLIMYIRDDGSFTYYVPHIVNNRFIWNGKEYSA